MNKKILAAVIIVALALGGWSLYKTILSHGQKSAEQKIIERTNQAISQKLPELYAEMRAAEQSKATYSHHGDFWAVGCVICAGFLLLSIPWFCFVVFDDRKKSPLAAHHPDPDH